MRIEEATYVALRMGAGFLFILHGLQKTFGLFGGLGGKPAALGSLMGVAGVIELVGGALLIIGLFARPIAALLAVEMLVAFLKVHMPRGGWPLQNGGELPILYALVFLFLAANGAGRTSVDAWRRRRRTRTLRDVVTGVRRRVASM